MTSHSALRFGGIISAGPWNRGDQSLASAIGRHCRRSGWAINNASNLGAKSHRHLKSDRAETGSKSQLSSAVSQSPEGSIRVPGDEAGDEAEDVAIDPQVDPTRARIRVEAALFLSPTPVSPRRLATLAGLSDATAARATVTVLNDFYTDHDRAMRVESVAGGYRMMTAPHLAPWLSRLSHLPAPVRLSLPMLETLAVVAYRGPVSRADIESIRGVACGDLLRQLIGRNLVRIAGRSEELGRPYLYDTTKLFLQTFGLRSTDDLPTIRLDDIGQQFADVRTADEQPDIETISDQPSVTEPSEESTKEPVVSTAVCTTNQIATEIDSIDLDATDLDAIVDGVSVSLFANESIMPIDATEPSEVTSPSAVIEDEEDDLYEDDGSWDDDDDDWDDPDDDDDIDLGDDDEDEDDSEDDSENDDSEDDDSEDDDSDGDDSDEDDSDDDSEDDSDGESSDLDDDWEEVDDDESDDEFEGDADPIDDDEDWGEDADEDAEDDDDDADGDEDGDADEEV